MRGRPYNLPHSEGRTVRDRLIARVATACASQRDRQWSRPLGPALFPAQSAVAGIPVAHLFGA